MESICKDPIVAPPDESFANFCKNRLEGLALTQNETNLELYKEAAKRGFESIQQNTLGKDA